MKSEPQYEQKVPHMKDWTNWNEIENWFFKRKLFRIIIFALEIMKHQTREFYLEEKMFYYIQYQELDHVV